MTEIRKIGSKYETLYVSGERSLCAVPFKDLRTVNVGGRPGAVINTGEVILGYESNGAIITVVFFCKSVEEAIKHKATIDALLVRELEAADGTN